MHIFTVYVLSRKRRAYSTPGERNKVTSVLCHEIASDNTAYLFVNSVNEPDPYEEVNKKGCALLDVQLMAEDIPCTFCTVQRGGRKGRLHEGSTTQSGFPP